MKIIWSANSLRDLRRIYTYLERLNSDAAERFGRVIIDAANSLEAFPSIGERIVDGPKSEFRRLTVEQYEIRYALNAETIRILHIYHQRQHR